VHQSWDARLIELSALHPVDLDEGIDDLPLPSVDVVRDGQERQLD
jgi:hypothetical protein